MAKKQPASLAEARRVIAGLRAENTKLNRRLEARTDIAEAAAEAVAAELDTAAAPLGRRQSAVIARAAAHAAKHSRRG